MTRSICVVTSTRADYGLLRWVMQDLRDCKDVNLQVVVTGTHLSPEFGLTVEEILADGFQPSRKVEMLLSSDTATGVTKSMGLGLIGFATAFNELRPDLLIVLGDRYEIFAAASAALIARIPVAHLHGGETTEGAVDEALRHSITKMSHLHFVATSEYRSRVVQLGEQPDRVFLVGGLGVDAIKRQSLLSREETETALGIKFGKRNLLVTYHPETLDSKSAGLHMRELLAALEALNDTQLIFTMPNADEGGREISKLIEQFVAEHDNAHAYTSLGQKRYLSCISHVDGVVGNSSSGLLEAPTFRKGTVDIGDRQKGRVKALSVISCNADRLSIKASVNRLYSDDFQSTLRDMRNPYGEGGASERIVKIVREHSLEGLVKKPFYDLPVQQTQGLSK